ncbi:MAG: DMT family transporter [Bacteroidota bacterium]|nr:DMT family transporter [Bacteroidota bacterium]
MQAFWFSLLVNSAFFIADIFIKLGSRELSAGRLVYIRSLFSVLLAGIWLLASGNFYPLPSVTVTLQLIGCSILCAIGLFTYVKALQQIHFVNVSVIGISGALIHYVLGILLFDEKANPWFYLAAVICISGIVIQWRKGNQRQGLIYAVISAITWGFGYALLSVPLQNTNAIWGTWIMEFCILILSAVFLFFADRKFNLFKPGLLKLNLFLVALFTILGSYLINICYQQFSLNILGFMQLAFFPYSLFAGYFIFKEKLSKIEWQGNLMIVAGLVLYFFTCT